MSNLNSNFDILRGSLDSALDSNFEPKAGSTYTEGTFVETTNRELPPAKVLRIKDNSLVTAPTLTASDRGKAYMIAGIGGVWSTFDIGDIVEWDGTDWNLIVAGVEAEPATGTRVVIIEASAAGSFTGNEEKVMTYTKISITAIGKALGYINAVAGDIGKPVVATGTGDTGHLVSYDNGTRTWVIDPDTPADVFAGNDVLAITGGTGASTIDSRSSAGGSWAVTTVPVSGNRLKINGSGSIYENKYYDYTGTHPAGAWYKAFLQKEAPAVIAALTSGVKASAVKPHAWVVIQGNDQFDGQFTNLVTCLKCSSGSLLKIPCTIANTLVPGDLIYSSAGAPTKLTSGAGMQWPLAQVIQSNSTAGSTGWIVIATY